MENNQPSQVTISWLSHQAGDGDSDQLSLDNEAWNAAWEQRRLIKQDPDRAVFEVNYGESPLLVKQFEVSKFQLFLEALQVAGSVKAQHARLCELRQAGIYVPRSHGIAQLAEGDRSSLLHLSEYLQDAKTLHQVLVDQKTEDAGTFSLKNNPLLAAVLEQLVALHELHRYHGDMKLTNIMVRDGAVYFVDVDGRQRRNSKRLWLKDLARLLVGLAEIGAPLSTLNEIIKAYCSRMSLAGNFDLAVMGKAQQIAARHARQYGRTSVLTEH